VVCGACINFFLNIFLIERYKSIGAAIASVVAEFVIAIVQMFYIRDILNLKRIFLGSWRNITSSIIMVIVLYATKSVIQIDALSLLFMIFISGIVYVLFLLLLRDKFLLSLINTVIVKRRV
jgi:peptidoglycan biosynthesis protein MviN/MurJ (putative lipid II flippase)